MADLFTLLVDLLEPFAQTSTDRQALLEQAVPDKQLLEDISWDEGIPSRTFVVNSCILLTDRQINGQPALLRLTNAFLDRIGAEERAQIEQIQAHPDELIEQIRSIKLQIEQLRTESSRFISSIQTAGTGVFLSYARKDDEPFVKRLHLDLTARGFVVWWDRVSMHNRGLPFLQEIGDAIDAADRFVLVAGKQALQSEYVYAEWTYALSKCKPINIALRQGEYEELPADLRDFDHQDFRDDAHYAERLDTLSRQLNAAVAPLGKIDSVPALPNPMLYRPTDVVALSRLVIPNLKTESGGTTAEKRTTILQGMGGIGKSVLAAAFANECAVRRAFPDGIVWLDVGQDATLRSLYENLGYALGDGRSNYPVDERTCQIIVQNKLSGKRCLIILDDVWIEGIAKGFHNLIAGSSARLLITTRKQNLKLDLGVREHRVERLNEIQAVELLRRWCGRDDPNLAAVAAKLDYLPLALKLAGRIMGTNGLSAEEYINKFKLVSSVQVPNLPGESRERDHSLDVSISVGVEAALGTDEADKLLYYTLGIFPEDVRVPQGTILRFWSALRPDLEMFKLEETLTILVDLALVERHIEDKTITLHDLLHSYTREKLGTRLQAMQQQFVDVYQTPARPWHQVRDDEGYIDEYLIYHLLEAGRYEDIAIIGNELDRYPQFRSGSVFARDLSAHYAQHSDALSPLLMNWLRSDQPNNPIAQIVANIAVTFEVEALLKRLLLHHSDRVQFIVVQESYQLWQQNPDLTKRLLRHLASQVSLLHLRGILPAISTLFRCSLLIGLNDQISLNPNPQTISFLASLWRPIVAKLFLVSPVAPLEAALSRIRRFIIGVVLSRLTKRLRDLEAMSESTINSIFRFADLEASFPVSPERGVIIHQLLAHFDAAAGRPESLDELMVYIRTLVLQGDNHSVSAYIGLVALLAHAFREPLRTTRLVGKLLEDFDAYYPPMRDTTDFTASIWYTTVGLTLANFDLKSFDRETAQEILKTLMDRRFILEQRYYTGHRFASGAIFRGNSCVGSIWGYELQMPELGYQAMKRYLDLLIERNDAVQINHSIYALIEGIDYYSLPRAAFDALADALRLLSNYIRGLSSDQRALFWASFTETLSIYGARHKEYLNAFINQHGDELLPVEVKTQLRNVVPAEDFNRIFSVSLLLFVRQTLQDGQSPMRGLVRWGLEQIIEARSLNDLILRWIGRLSNLIYGKQIINDL